MKKLFSVTLALTMMFSLLVSTVSAAPEALLTPTLELGQLKVCKIAGSGVEEGTLFTFKVNGNEYNVPAGPADRNGFCILAGQYPVGTHITIEEAIPSGYYVSRIEVKPDRVVSKNTSQGIVTVQIVSGVIEAIFTNKIAGTKTPTLTPTSATPRPTKTATSTPSCDPNCTPTSTPVPTGRLQICKEAAGAGVTGSFTFKFENRSRSVPVGACAGLIAVNAGTLTITETAQAGFSVADIYTIPADRLMNKDLSAGSAVVRIIEGTAASQTIVVFRNRAVTTGTVTPTSTSTSTPTGSVTPSATNTSTSTPTATGTATGSLTPTFTATATPTGSMTSTPTFTPTATSTVTGTITETTCTTEVISADFTNIPVGGSVEGLGTVAPYLNIDAQGTALKVATGINLPRFAYLAPNAVPGVTPVFNGGLSLDGGFSDVRLEGENRVDPHHYTFTFAPGVTVTYFSLHMLDFGDLNMPLGLPPATNHYASMTAYDAAGNVVSGPLAKHELSYTTNAVRNPRQSNLYGDLYFNGDAITAPLGQPGNWIWTVSGNGIAKIVLEFKEGWDPNIAFDSLTFATGCPNICQGVSSANFSNVPVGQPVEGLGKVTPNLNIDANYGTAVRVAEGVPQGFAYLAPNAAPGVTSIVNGGLAADGGFSDLDAQQDGQPHKYTFTFSPGVTVNYFSLHMLDFGDLNMPAPLPPATSHYASMTAYDAAGNPIPGLYAKQEMSYTTNAVRNPRQSNLYGDLYFNGDAQTALRGQPGNWTWTVSGNGIAKVVLEFGEGYDPNIGFDLLTYSAFCQ